MTDDQKILLTQKGVYPYDYMCSFDKFQDAAFSTIEQCYSRSKKVMNELKQCGGHLT